MAEALKRYDSATSTWVTVASVTRIEVGGPAFFNVIFLDDLMIIGVPSAFTP